MLPGSVLPDRGFRPAPLGAASHVLEKDRAELNEAQRALAPGNYGVHAGAVDVVSANAAVAIAVEGRRITTVSAISLTGDEIDECRFFCLLHYSPQCDGNRPQHSRGRLTGPGRDGRWGEYTVSIGHSQGVIWARWPEITTYFAAGPPFRFRRPDHGGRWGKRRRRNPGQAAR